MKVAIVHDWFVGGGAERVVYEIHKIYPDAPIYTSYCTPQWQQRLPGAKIITSYMQRWPFSKLRKFLPVLRAAWFSHLNLAGYDLVISSSGAEAKAVRTGPNTKHICYMHAPTHYYWSRYDGYMKSPGFGWLDPLARLGLRLLVGPMRRWDYKAAQRPDYIIANSNFTKDQIKKYYGRDSVVIHPPVDIERFETRNKKRETRSGFLTAGRQTPYKRIDLAVAACSRLNLPLTVIGSGPDHKRLVKMAGPSINFLTGLSDTELVRHFQTAQAFIFPGIDDFGIVAVEALAAGTPVIAYKAGGALDYVQDGKTGRFFSRQTVENLASVLQSFDASDFSSEIIIKASSEFSAQAFRTAVHSYIKNL